MRRRLLDPARQGLVSKRELVQVLGEEHEHKLAKAERRHEKYAWLRKKVWLRAHGFRVRLPKWFLTSKEAKP